MSLLDSEVGELEPPLSKKQRITESWRAEQGLSNNGHSVNGMPEGEETLELRRKHIG